MILSQALGNDFHRLGEDDLGRLNSVIHAELVRNPEIHNLIQKVARNALKAGARRPSAAKKK